MMIVSVALEWGGRPDEQSSRRELWRSWGPQCDAIAGCIFLLGGTGLATLIPHPMSCHIGCTGLGQLAHALVAEAK